MGVLPDEFPAVRTVGGLPQVCGHKLVTVDLMDSPSHCPLALPGEMLEDAVSLEGGCGEQGKWAEAMTWKGLATQTSGPKFKSPTPT